MLRRPLAALVATALTLLAAAIPASAPAADAIYWTNLEGAPVSSANLNGGGAGNLALTGVVSSMPGGLTLDPADGKLFFSNVGTESIQWAYLDGSGGGQINTAPVSLGEPVGLAVDHAAGRVYWSSSNQIAYARIDGSGASVLNTTGATIEQPWGLAIDPRAGRIYWANFKFGATKVSYANLDGSGGGDISEEPSAENGTGVALDPASGRVFWSTLVGGIHSSNLDGSNVVDVSTAGTTNPESIRSIAIDPPSNRVFWAEEGPPAAISFANLNGSGGDDLGTGTANLAFPHSVSILRAPAGTAPPTITGQLTARSTLTCSQGGWAPDAPASLFYRAPRSFAYQWLRGGAPIAGTTQPTLIPASSGAYSCQVTATNYAGSTSQTSAAVSVGSRNALAARLAMVKKGKAFLRLRCPGPERCRGLVGLIALYRHRGTFTVKRIRYSASAKFSIAAGKKQVVRVKLKAAALSALQAKRSHELKASLTGSGVDSRTILLKEAKKKPRKPRR